MRIKTYWQAMDGDGEEGIYTERPTLDLDGQYSANAGCSTIFLFPLALKPLQCVKITVRENTTWGYEIERGEGWYAAKSLSNNTTYILEYRGGLWKYPNGGGATFGNFQVSPTRIPDECII